MIDLREKDRVRIIELAQKTLPKNTQVWAFGSRVKGTNHDASDLDLVLTSAHKDDFSLEHWSAFKEALQDSNIPILIQVLSGWHIPIPVAFIVAWVLATLAQPNHIVPLCSEASLACRLHAPSNA